MKNANFIVVAKHNQDTYENAVFYVNAEDHAGAISQALVRLCKLRPENVIKNYKLEAYKRAA